jgi:RNA polymerase sigma factor (sigma-70 family)
LEALLPGPVATYPNPNLERWLAEQRPRLLRLTAYLSGSYTAEDLTQETLLEAWRNQHKLPTDADSDDLARWLNAVARNVCLRWRRAHGRDAAHSLHALDEDAGTSSLDPIAEVADTFDVEHELEREELASLLDRALSHLPRLSRTILTQRFVDDLPQSEIAAGLGITTDAVAQRIARGKQLLRRLLTTDLRAEAATFGIALASSAGDDEWQPTRIWCPFCGQHYLRYIIERVGGGVAYACSGGCVYPSGQLCGLRATDAFTTLVSPKSILTRILLNLNDHYRSALTHHPVPCPQCGGAATARTEFPDALPSAVIALRGLYMLCPTCGPVDGASLWHLAIDRPETQAFWRAHPRMHALPICEVEAEGCPAYVTGFASGDNSRRVEYVRARDTLDVLSVHQTA